MKALFGAEHANVQTHSGTQANVSVYMASLQLGDTVLGMNLAHGGHLTHGHPLNFSGKMYKFIPYGVSKETETIDYEELNRLAQEHKPKMIVAERERLFAHHRLSAHSENRALGGSSLLCGHGAHRWTRRWRNCIRRVRCHMPISFPLPRTRRCADRAADWSCAQRRSTQRELDRITFPGTQGGPLMHVIAAKAVCLKEAADPGFREYAKQVVANAKKLAAEIANTGFRIVSGGTDNHLS